MNEIQVSTPEIRKDTQMKAIVYTEYGPPDDALELQDIGKPAVKDKEVLV